MKIYHGNLILTVFLENLPPLLVFFTESRVQDYVPKALRKQIYHVLFESHLTYCISVWGGQSFSTLKNYSLYKSTVSGCCSQIQRKIPSVTASANQPNQWSNVNAVMSGISLGLSELDIDLNIDHLYCNE